MKILMLAMVLMVLPSCGGHLHLSMRGCGSRPIALGTGEDPILYNGHVWHKTNDRENKIVLVRELLRQKNIDCTKLERVSYVVGQDALDQFLSFLPFMRRSHIIIRGVVI